MTESDVEVASDDEGARAGRCAIVGRPNVGKSTLLNALLGQKLAIATSKPQTTRHRILGVYVEAEPPTQIAFVDTPGLHRPKNALGRALVEEAQGALEGSDVVLWLIESPSDRTNASPGLLPADREVRDLLRSAGSGGPKLVLGLNKVDRLKDKTKLFPWLEYYQRELAPEAVVPIAALKERGLPQLISELRKHLPPGVLYDDPDFVTDRPERFFVGELIREAAIRNTREEVPYAVAVLIDSFEEGGGITRVQASIIVEKQNHKKIVVGAAGSMLKKIGSEARAEIEKLLERKIFLGLFVKVVEGWTEDPKRVRELAMETSFVSYQTDTDLEDGIEEKDQDSPPDGPNEDAEDEDAEDEDAEDEDAEDEDAEDEDGDEDAEDEDAEDEDEPEAVGESTAARDESEADDEGSERVRPRRRQRKERPAGARTPRPLVAVVGRPNVGKSTLFNRLARANIAAVEDRPGVTRDRHYVDAEALGSQYVLIDTGGFDPDSDDPMQEGIARQVRLALEEADVVMCVLDASTELLSADREAVKLLRRANKPVLFVANKCDSERRIAEATSLYELGIDQFYPVSALHSRGIGDLEEALHAALPPPKEVEESGYEDAPHIAIIGRPNAGKSSLVNQFLGEERQLVDSRPGTTVDSIDTLLDKRGKRYVLIDTAGIRRKSRKKENVEQLGILQAVRAIERCDIVILMIDASEGVAEQDAKIAGIAADRSRAMIVVLNKSDLLTREELDKAIQRTSEVLNFAQFAPIMTLSALTGRGTTKLLEKVDVAMESFRRRVSTGELNRFFEQVLEHHPPPPQSGRSIRLYYVTQAQVEPPTFVAVTNHPDDIHFSYKRYVANQIRKRFDFVGTPVRVMYRKKKNKRPNS